MKRLYITASTAFATAFAPQIWSAQECWAISNLKGYSAYSDKGYKFGEDGLNPLVVCFTAEGGTVTGSDIRFVKFGTSTLAGYGGNDRGNELFEVYQLDRDKRKLLYTKTRIAQRPWFPSSPTLHLPLSVTRCKSVASVRFGSKRRGQVK